jgi:hypothetical protein
MGDIARWKLIARVLVEALRVHQALPKRAVIREHIWRDDDAGKKKTLILPL